MNTKLTYQNYGGAILIFIEAENEKEAHNKWLSLFNWNCTSSEPEYVSDNVISCWSTVERLQRYLFNSHIMKLWDTQVEKFKGKKHGFMNEALRLAKEEYESICRESFRSVNNNFEFYEMGTINAERPDEDFGDAVLSYAFSHKRD